MNIKRQEEVKEMLCSCDDCIDKDIYYNQLVELGKTLKTDKKLGDIVAFQNALGNKNRFIIVMILKDKARCVCELEAILDKSQPSISHHLRGLERVGLIRGWKKGKFTYYNLEKDQLNNYLNLLKEIYNFEK